MDKLVTTARERSLNPEAFARDEWIKGHAARLAPGSWVLDAGAGASKYRPFFAHCRYEAQDFCQYQGPLVNYLEPIKYVCDVASVPLPTACLDAILCTEVLEHVVDPMAVLAEFARLLKPGGKLFLTAPLLSHLHMEPYHYYGGFTHYWYRHWLPKRGFSVDSILPVGGPARSCVVFSQALYSSWLAAEKKLTPLPRFGSKVFRAFFKLKVQYVMPWLLPRFDPWLGNHQICSNYLVAATRLPEGM